MKMIWRSSNHWEKAEMYDFQELEHFLVSLFTIFCIIIFNSKITEYLIILCYFLCE